MRLRLLLVSVLIMMTFMVLIEPSVGQPEEMNLEGEIYLWDDTPLQGRPWEDATPFALWVLHSGTWNRFPKTGWVLSSGGWYAYTLEAAERDINWSNGDTYRVQIDATDFGGLNTNATSHGTGDPGEFPPFGELENTIMWSDPDNTQQWDVVVPIPDLQPFAIAVDGTEYPGPYDPTVPIGPIVAPPGSGHTIEANVTNDGSPLIRVLNTATLGDSCGLLVNMGEIQQIGAKASAPPSTRFSRQWTAPSLPFVGNCVLNYSVDSYNNVTEYNETNNSATIVFDVEAPDLTPAEVMIQTASGAFFYNDTSETLPPFHSEVIPANPGDVITIIMNATNVGGYETGKQFNVAMVDTGSIPEGPPLSIMYNSGEVGPLAAGDSVGPFVSNFRMSNQTGYHCLNLTVDYGLDGLGNVSEVSETNNTFVVCFGVDVPDLTPVDIVIELGNGSSFSYPDASIPGYTSDPIYVFPGDLINLSASVRNVGVFPTPMGVETQISFCYVGDDPSNSPVDRIAEWGNVPQLNPGSGAGPYSHTGYSVPFDLGDQYISITVDNSSLVQEANETNNTFTIHLVIGGPDVIPRFVNLTVDGLTTQYVYPESPTVDVSITSIVEIEAIVENSGNFGTGGTFVTEFSDSSTAFLSRVGGPLGSGDIAVTNSSWSNPGIPSIHTILVVADALDDIEELNETNNLFTLTIVVKGADLIPLNVSVNVGGRSAQYQYSESPVGPVLVDISDVILLNVTVLNQGGLESGIFSVGFLDAGLSFNLSGPLGPLGPSLAVSMAEIGWPNPMMLGDYPITISVDHFGNVSEVDEENNDFRILFRVVGPDVVAFDFLVNGMAYSSSVEVVGGETVLLTCIAFNAGSNVTPARFYVSIYNSTQRNNPLLLLDVEPLSPGKNLWFNVTWLAPMDYLTAGITFEVDFYDDIVEIDESNNTLESVLIVTPLPPDLVAVNPEINSLPYQEPYQAQAGEVILFSAAIGNIGNYTTGGPFDNAFYNETMYDFPFERTVEGTLIPSRTTEEIEAIWQAPEKNGTYVVVFHADYLDSIPEANESNNVLRFVIEVREKGNEYNWKPILALVFALVLALLGILIGYLRPLDRFIPVTEDMPDEERKAYHRQMKSLPIGKKLKELDNETLLKKFGRDRILTILLLALPLSLTEIVVAILSALRGILRVPEDGNWITVGLVVNLLILIIGISVDTIVAKKGYRVPTEMLEPPPPDDE
ncbi:MAG: CARDB domain-containing protein [Thermoplasmata archaeon]